MLFAVSREELHRQSFCTSLDVEVKCPRPIAIRRGREGLPSLVLVKRALPRTRCSLTNKAHRWEFPRLLAILSPMGCSHFHEDASHRMFVVVLHHYGLGQSCSLACVVTLLKRYRMEQRGERVLVYRVYYTTR